jgi:hypothetical protein
LNQILHNDLDKFSKVKTTFDIQSKKVEKITKVTLICLYIIIDYKYRKLAKQENNLKKLVMIQ